MGVGPVDEDLPPRTRLGVGVHPRDQGGERVVDRCLGVGGDGLPQGEDGLEVLQVLGRDVGVGAGGEGAEMDAAGGVMGVDEADVGAAQDELHDLPGVGLIQGGVPCTAHRPVHRDQNAGQFRFVMNRVKGGSEFTTPAPLESHPSSYTR